METPTKCQSSNSGLLMWGCMMSVSLISTAGNTQVLPAVVAGNALTRG